MYSAIYVEQDIATLPRVQDILRRYPRIPVVECERYGEVFNRNAQNFRIQKRKPALILARKHGSYVLPVPEGYDVGGDRNYYFSHMLNCVYDCRYCFLQGMYRSAHYVLFVNYEDFANEIVNTARESESEQVHFFSGYDCDSLALDPLTGFSEFYVPIIREQRNAWLELRTKSTQVRQLLKQPAFDRCVVAFSFTPDAISQAVEHKVPELSKRLDAMVQLQEKGWKLGLRFDPLIYHANFAERYDELFKQIFSRLDVQALHSVSLGVFRLPTGFHKTMQKLYPDEPLLYSGLQRQGEQVAYNRELEKQLLEHCEARLLHYISSDIYFPCGVAAQTQ